jgi:aryl-alcohol dehydrogenase-like predicted oxidoreductase
VLGVTQTAQTPPSGATSAVRTSEPGHRRLGASGLAVSAVGLGCNNFGGRIDAAATDAVVGAALDAGITLFDTADVYGGTPGLSEELLGRALGSRRHEAVVATKFGLDLRGANGPDWGARGSRRYVRTAVEASLRRLGTDWIDLYQLHTPDPLTPLEETLAALHELVTEGKVRYVGSSNLTAWQVVDADWTARTAGLTPFVSAQNEYSLLDRSVEDELVPACEHVGVGLLPYFPLASGLLTGKYRRGEDAPGGTRLASRPERLAAADFDRIEAIGRFADERGLSMLDVAVGGLAAQPAVASVIAGATTPEQVRANVAAGCWQPTADDLAALDEVAPG